MSDPKNVFASNEWQDTSHWLIGATYKRASEASWSIDVTYCIAENQT